jgi:hypothetical protein
VHVPVHAASIRLAITGFMEMTCFQIPISHPVLKLFRTAGGVILLHRGPMNAPRGSPYDIGGFFDNINHDRLVRVFEN